MIQFFAPGIPRPGGSKTYKGRSKAGRAILVDASKYGKDWRAMVALACADASRAALEGPLSMDVTFIMPRPKSHYRANGALKDSAPVYHTSKPDATKLMRSTEDALTGIAWRDDAQVVRQTVVKMYGERPGAEVVIRKVD
jgi:Holliday junction resolvase RusA-like endonuclease